MLLNGPITVMDDTMEHLKHIKPVKVILTFNHLDIGEYGDFCDDDDETPTQEGFIDHIKSIIGDMCLNGDIEYLPDSE